MAKGIRRQARKLARAAKKTALETAKLNLGNQSIVDDKRLTDRGFDRAMQNPAFAKQAYNEPDVVKEFDKRPNDTFKRAVRAAKITDIENTAYTSTSITKRLAARAYLGAERSLYRAGGELGEAFRQSKRASTKSEAKSIRKDYFLRFAANKIEGAFGIAGEAIAQRIRQNINNIREDDPRLAFVNVKKNFVSIADHIIHIEDILQKQNRLFTSSLDQIEQRFKGVTKVDATVEVAKEGLLLKGNLKDIQSLIDNQGSQLRNISGEMGEIRGKVESDESRLKRLAAEIDELREKMIVSSISSSLAFGSKKNNLGGNPANQLNSDIFGVASGGAAGAWALKKGAGWLRKSNALSKMGALSRLAMSPAGLGIMAGIAGIGAAGYMGYQGYNYIQNKRKMQKDGTFPANSDELGHDLNSIEGVTQNENARSWGGKAADNARAHTKGERNKEKSDSARVITDVNKNKRHLLKNNKYEITEEFLQKIKKIYNKPTNNDNIDNRIYKSKIDEQKSQFMQFGALPTGFEFLSGHRGRLGQPSAVAASGAMPLSGNYSSDYSNSVYSNNNNTSNVIRSSGGRQGGYGFTGSMDNRQDSNPALTKWLGQDDNSSGGLAGIRAKYLEELKDPAIRDKILALTYAEVGNRPTPDRPKAQRALIETIMNRAEAHGYKSLDAAMSKAYYEPLQTGAYDKRYSELQNNPDLKKSLDDRLEEVLKGSNDSNFGLHNASAGVAESARRTQNITAELGGETFSSKTNPDFARMHGAGTIQKEQAWIDKAKSAVEANKRMKAGELKPLSLIPKEALNTTSVEKIGTSESNSGYAHPLSKSTMLYKGHGRTAEFGYGRGRLHAGVDLYDLDSEGKLKVGDKAKVFAPETGKITAVLPNRGRAGNMIIMTDANGMQHRFLHTAETPLINPDTKEPYKSGDKVSKGTPITTITGSGTDYGAVANKLGHEGAMEHFNKKGWGSTNMPHLHYELRDSRGGLTNPKTGRPYVEEKFPEYSRDNKGNVLGNAPVKQEPVPMKERALTFGMPKPKEVTPPTATVVNPPAVAKEEFSQSGFKAMIADPKSGVDMEGVKPIEPVKEQPLPKLELLPIDKPAEVAAPVEPQPKQDSPVVSPEGLERSNEGKATPTAPSVAAPSSGGSYGGGSRHNPETRGATTGSGGRGAQGRCFL